MDIFGTIANVIGLAKKARDLADQLKNLELKTVIVDLQSQLLDMKTECLAYREELDKLRAENKRLSAPPEVELRDGAYYKKEGGDGPFCTACHDSKGSMIRVVEAPDPEQRMFGTRWRCPVCKASLK